MMDLQELADGGVDSLAPEVAIVREVPDEEPDPPDELPEYLLDATDRQSSDKLRALAHYALARAAYQDRPLQEDELDEDAIAGDSEELVELQEDGDKGTIVKKKIPCGDESCSQCPHGPYKYRNYREDGEHKTEYLGKVN